MPTHCKPDKWSVVDAGNTVVVLSASCTCGNEEHNWGMTAATANAVGTADNGRTYL